MQAPGVRSLWGVVNVNRYREMACRCRPWGGAWVHPVCDRADARPNWRERAGRESRRSRLRPGSENLYYRDRSDVVSPEGCLAEIKSVACSSRENRVLRSDRFSSDKERGSAGGAAVGAACAASRGLAESAAGIFSAGIDKPAAGVLSSGTTGVAAVTLSSALVRSSTGGALRAFIGAGESALPRMIGSPSLPPPMITTFELLDCAS